MQSDLHPLRQSAAELLAYAVCDLFPKTLIVNGVVTTTGFYYEFVLPKPIDEQSLTIIEERMRAVVSMKMPIRTLDMMHDNAVTFLYHHKKNIRAELVDEETDEVVQVFQMGDFVDSCPGPFVENSSEITSFKLQEISTSIGFFDKIGEVTITRISGTAFEDNYTLKKFLKLQEQAKKRDHRLVGPALNLFSLLGDEESGCWLWHPRGNTLREILLDCLRNFPKNKNAIAIHTPPLTPAGSLLKILKGTGLKDLENDLLNPSLFHALHYKSQTYSNHGLPVRYQECALQHESISNLESCGLIQTETYTTDLTHIFCTREQIEGELISCLQFIDKIIKIFGFEHRWYLRVKGAGSKDQRTFWKKSVDYLEQALKACGIEYTLDTQTPMRYGPRAEVGIVDSLNREWNGPYTGIDITHPERLGLRYHENDDHSQLPVMIVHSLFGPIERFIALLVEHYAGNFPFWLAPEQVRVIPLSNSNADYASKICAQLVQAGFRSEIDYRPGSLGEKVHLAEREKIPHIAIVGDVEEKKNVIALRSGNNSQKKSSVTLDELLQLLQQEDSNTLLNRVQNESPKQ